MVKRMERAGLLKRERDSEDKRAVRVRLTGAGRCLEPRVRVIAKRLRNVLDDGFTAAEARALRAGLARVVHNLHEHLKSSESP